MAPADTRSISEQVGENDSIWFVELHTVETEAVKCALQG
jgi:hypothetical protein